MGTLLLLVAVGVELILVVMRLRTKSSQETAGGAIRIGAFTCFVLLVTVGLLDWSFRYYALSALLLLLAGRGAVGFIRKKGETVPFKAGRAVLRAVGMTALMCLVTLPAIIFPQYRPLEVTGRYQVLHTTATYLDPRRIETYASTGEHRKLGVGFWYPDTADGKYPLVVFSHGGISTMTSNESLYRELASQGYVVASISHTFHALATTDEDGKTRWVDQDYMRELQVEDAKTNRQQSYDYYRKWMKVRMDDISFVIDYILSEARQVEAGAIFRLVDTGAIGVMGHSTGGSAALGIGRIRDDVGAVIALESPFMYDIQGVADGEFVFNDEVYPVPVLNIYSDSAWSHLAEWPQYAQNYALFSDAEATAFHVHISGVGHFTLTDLALSSPVLTRMFNGFRSTTNTESCLRTINKLCVAFLDSYLKHDGEFAAGGTY